MFKKCGIGWLNESNGNKYISLSISLKPLLKKKLLDRAKEFFTVDMDDYFNVRIFVFKSKKVSGVDYEASFFIRDDLKDNEDDKINNNNDNGNKSDDTNF